MTLRSLAARGACLLALGAAFSLVTYGVARSQNAGTEFYAMRLAMEGLQSEVTQLRSELQERLPPRSPLERPQPALTLADLEEVVQPLKKSFEVVHIQLNGLELRLNKVNEELDACRAGKPSAKRKP